MVYSKKSINELVKKAEKVEAIEINPSFCEEVNEKVFIEPITEVFICERELFRKKSKTSSKWLKYKLKIISNDKRDINELKEAIIDMIKWGENLKKYIDENIEMLASELKEYVDSKT